MSGMSRTLERWWLTLVAMMHIVLGRKRDGVDVYRRILVLSPDDPMVLTTLGNLLAETDDVDGALATFRTLLERHPKNADGWFNLGYLLEKRGELAEAESCFRRAVELRPTLDRAWYGLGLTLIRDDRLEEAVEALKRTTKLQPFSPYGWYQLGMTYHHLGQEAKAARIHDELRKFEPRYAATLLRDMQGAPRRAAAKPEPEGTIEID